MDNGPFTTPALVADDLNNAMLAPGDSILDNINHLFHSKDGSRHSQPIALDLEFPESRTAVRTPVVVPASPFRTVGPLSCSLADVGSLVPIPNRAISPLDPPSSQRISGGCRRFILTVIRTYRRMTTQLGNWPPFVHPIGCGLHFNHRDSSISPAPLKPLAACQSIARIFVSRTPNRTDFIWRTIENERREILNKLGCLSWWQVPPWHGLLFGAYGSR